MSNALNYITFGPIFRTLPIFKISKEEFDILKQREREVRFRKNQLAMLYKWLVDAFKKGGEGKYYAQNLPPALEELLRELFE